MFVLLLTVVKCITTINIEICYNFIAWDREFSRFFFCDVFRTDIFLSFGGNIEKHTQPNIHWKRILRTWAVLYVQSTSISRQQKRLQLFCVIHAFYICLRFILKLFAFWESPLNEEEFVTNEAVALVVTNGF